MKTLFLLFLSISLCASAQENIELKFDSKILSESRVINIHIPASYSSSNKTYPVIYAMDGEYTKLALSGSIDYYSFWGKIPECIIVSINQNYKDTVESGSKRWRDCSYSWKTGMPDNKGVKFKDFVSKELVPSIDSIYRTSNFKVIVGHSFTANFVNYFLLDEQPIFQGYVAISPYYASNGLDSIKTIIEHLKNPIYYFVASGGNDLSGHIKSVKKFDKEFSKVKNENFNYKIVEGKDNKATHSTIFPIALPMAIEHLFSSYSSIGKSEFKQLLKEQNKVKYLYERYENIKELYGVDIEIREDDIYAVSYAISKKKQWKQLKEIGALAIDLYPNSCTGYYILGEYEEKIGHFELALTQYELGFSKLGDDILNISDFQKDIDRMKSKLKKAK